MLDLVRRNSRENYRPGKTQSVDEGMIKYKGHFYARQYMPNKPTRRGMKVCINLFVFCSPVHFRFILKKSAGILSVRASVRGSVCSFR